MPPLKDATKKPSNIGELIPPATPTAQNPPPIIPREQPGLSPTALGPAPAVWTTGFDSIRQWVRPGTSQSRFPSLPTKSNPQINASSRGVSSQVVAPVVAQTSTNTANIATNTAAITTLQQTQFQGVWSSSVSYSKNASVDFGGTLFYSLINSNLNNNPASTVGVDWASLGSDTGFAGVWNNATAYSETQQVTASDGNYYIALVSNTNVNPLGHPATWQLVGPTNLDSLANGSVSGKTNNTALTSGNVDPSKSGVLAKGSFPPTLSNSYSYVSTATSATVMNNGQNILRSDGTTTSVPNGSQAITGLLASKTYYLYPYWDETLLSQNFVSSSPSIPNLAGVTENGSTGFVSTTTSTSLAAGSIEAWFRTTSGVSGMLVELNPNQTGAPNTTTSYFGLEVRGTGAVVGIAAHAGSVTSGIAYNDGVWHHAVMTAVGGGGAVLVYVDGVLTASGSATISAVAAFWRMGSGGATGSSFFLNGTIAHVAVYNSVLTAAQIANHYSVMTASGPSAYSTVVANDGASFYWKLNETVGTTAADSIGTNTGTYQGGFTLNQSQAVLSPVGSPAIAWTQPSSGAAQQQNLQGFVPLSTGAIAVATTSGGTGGGNSSGGATPSCFSGNTLVVTKSGNRRFDELTTDDEVLTAGKTWKRIKEILVHDYDGLAHNLGESEFVTPDHLILSGKWRAASDVFERWQPFSGRVYNLIVDTDEAAENILDATTERSYTLTNGVIAHNAKIFK